MYSKSLVKIGCTLVKLGLALFKISLEVIVIVFVKEYGQFNTLIIRILGNNVFYNLLDWRIFLLNITGESNRTEYIRFILKQC
ncbi:hypothetical protein D3C71_2067990 [compost metagenome]